MRISAENIKKITEIISELAGDGLSVTLFGSRVDDGKRGGDIDLLVESAVAVDNPAWLAAQISAQVSRLMAGRQVDVLIGAPNLKQLPIHEVAKSTGILL